MDYAANKAKTAVDYQELIDELHSSYQIQETSRKKLDDDETEPDGVLSVLNFKESAGNAVKLETRQQLYQFQWIQFKFGWKCKQFEWKLNQ